MATAKTISQRIALEGAEDIRRLLEQIGNVGEKAFAQISAAVSPATKNLEGLSKAIANVQVQVEKVAAAGRNFGSSLQNLGGAANNFGASLATVATRISVITAAAGAAAAGVAAFAISAVKAADDIGETAAALGLSTKSYQELQFAAAQAGVSQEQFATGMARLSKNIEDAAAKEAKALLDFAESAKKSLQQPGVHVVDMSRDFTREFQVINEAAQRLQQQLKSRGIDIPLFRIREELKKLADGGADARKKFEELTGQALRPTTDGLEQLRLQAETGGNALARLGVRTRDLSGNIRPTEDIIGDIADRFAALPEGAQRTATALELFGRSGAKLGAFLAQGRAGLQATIKELERLGILLSKDEVAAADQAANALDLLGLTLQNLRNKLGLVFAEPIREGANALIKFISANSSKLQEFAKSIAAKVVPVVRDLFNLLSGNGQAVENEWILKARDSVVEFIGAIRRMADGVSGAALIIVRAFAAVRDILQNVAAAINAVFKTTLTGDQIGIAIIVAQLIGAFGVLTSTVLLAAAAIKAISAGLAFLLATGGLVVRVLIAIGTALVALVGWPALIVAGLAAAIAAIVVFWDQIKRGAAAVWEAIKTGASAAWEFVKNTFTKTFSGAWQWVVDAFDTAVATVKKKADELVEFLKKKFTNAPIQGGNTAPEIQQPQSAPGGGPLGALVQPASLTGAGGQTSNQVAAIRQGMAAATAELEKLASTSLQLIQSLVNEATIAIAGSFTTVTTSAQTAAAGIAATMQAATEAVVAAITSALQRAGQAAQAMLSSLSAGLQATFVQMQAAVTALAGSINAIVQSVLSNLEAAVSRAQALAAAAQAAAAAAASAGGGSPANPPTGPGLAGGGMVWGAGTETSDSIPARLSRGEFVQRAAAVRYYGADFMAALNALRIPRDAFRGFNVGGLVDGLSRSMAALAVPRFAMGGLADLAPAGGGRHLGTLNLALPSGRTVSVMADSEVAEALFREVKRSGMNAAVKKPF